MIAVIGYQGIIKAFRLPVCRRLERAARIGILRPETCFIEAGGLERAIGSYSVNTQRNVSGVSITYLDRITFRP